MAVTSERKIVHIINPVSGSGRKFRKTRSAINALGESIYLTKRESDCEEFVAEYLAKDPYAHIVAHGGDGTMCEAVSGIMAAGAGSTAL
ncbi:MAG: acylglycerol kinase family protein, partial [Clostridia bacterium]|nr:acylglycerol kinase family protein [Clostridia bacterium]